MKTDELRQKYLDFFVSKGHTRCESDVLVPKWDPSVLFTPAGMNPFKDHFLGKVKLSYTRATSCQKCLRTGDIDNVGRTAYHHTFFEMLGNFSFGDYFKRDAIHWAWEFLTDKKWLGIPGDRLSVTVYLDDDEAAGIWQKEIGLPPARIERMGEDDNFWPASAPSQGPDGVCGPCSEIYYHPEQGKAVEIWNLVFTQFNRVGEPPHNLKPLPSKNIDTGMGLERCVAVMQGVDTNYHIDSLRPLVEAAAEVCGIQYVPGEDSARRCRRIADHIRACSFAIHENVLPGKNKQPYVVRRLMRRAILDGHQLGLREPFLFHLVPLVARQMAAAYPELKNTVDRVAEAVRDEEKLFFGNLDAGLARIEKLFNEMRTSGSSLVGGTEAANLYQTYGIQPELLENMAAELNFKFDWVGFRRSMDEHGEASGKIADVVFKTGPIEALKKDLLLTEFLGYQATEASVEIKGLVAQDQLLDHVREVGHENPIQVVLDRSPFYGESGGQVGDVGEIVGQGFRFLVLDTKKEGDLIVHHGHLASGEMHAGDKATARVETTKRNAIRRAHSATHLLHFALQQCLGKDAHQQGSKVDGDWLRFDFGCRDAVAPETLVQIERQVHEKISAAEPISWKHVPLSEARAAGAMMLFGEKYPDPARMVTMGNFSRELCAGTHLDNTGDVAAFEIVSEESLASGVRRIVAITGDKAKEYSDRTRQSLAKIAGSLACDPSQVPAAVKALALKLRDLKKALAQGGKAPDSTPSNLPPKAGMSAAEAKTSLRETARALNCAPFDAPERVQAILAEIENLKQSLATQSTVELDSAESLLAKGERIGATLVIVAETPGANPNLMRQWIDAIRRQSGSSALLLGTRQAEDKVLLIAALSHDLVSAGHSAGNWVKEAALVVGGSGGGKPDLAQAGGKLPAKLPEALAAGKAAIKKLLG